MAQEDYWFRHDANALGDDKIEALVLRFGMAGYGMYWVVVETMRNKDGYHLPRKDYVIAALAKKTMATPEQVNNFLHACINDFELFDEDEDGIYSASLLRRMEAWEEKKQRRATAGRKGAEAKAKHSLSNATALPEHCQSNGTAELKQTVARREEKSREEKSRVENTSADAVIDYLNEKASKSYQHTEANRKPIRARLSDGFTVDQCRRVVDVKTAEWRGTDMDKYLRPPTLFAPSKFEGYLNQREPDDDDELNLYRRAE